MYICECSAVAKCCGKQYVGETTGDFRFRWSNYKINNRKYTRNEDCFQEYLFRHFHSGEHTGFLENVKLTLIDKIDSQNSKKREGYWRRTLQTYAPFELNVEGSVWACFTTFGRYLLVSHLVLHGHLRYFFNGYK